MYIFIFLLNGVVSGLVCSQFQSQISPKKPCCQTLTYSKGQIILWNVQPWHVIDRIIPLIKSFHCLESRLQYLYVCMMLSLCPKLKAKNNSHPGCGISILATDHWKIPLVRKKGKTKSAVTHDITWHKHTHSLTLQCWERRQRWSSRTVPKTHMNMLEESQSRWQPMYSSLQWWLCACNKPRADSRSHMFSSTWVIKHPSLKHLRKQQPITQKEPNKGGS